MSLRFYKENKEEIFFFFQEKTLIFSTNKLPIFQECIMSVLLRLKARRNNKKE